MPAGATPPVPGCLLGPWIGCEPAASSPPFGKGGGAEGPGGFHFQPEGLAARRLVLKVCKVLPTGTPKGQMPPHVLPTHLFGGICRGHVTSRTHHHSRLPPLRVRAAQALPVKGFPKGKPLWSIFGHFLLIKKVATPAQADA